MPGEGRLSSGNRFRGINIDITRRARLSLPQLLSLAIWVSLTPVVLSIVPIFALHIAPEINIKTLTKFNIRI